MAQCSIDKNVVSARRLSSQQQKAWYMYACPQCMLTMLGAAQSNVEQARPLQAPAQAQGALVGSRRIFRTCTNLNCSPTVSHGPALAVPILQSMQPHQEHGLGKKQYVLS